jgi:hypothetical protein
MRQEAAREEEEEEEEGDIETADECPSFGCKSD